MKRLVLLCALLLWGVAAWSQVVAPQSPTAPPDSVGSALIDDEDDEDDDGENVIGGRVLRTAPGEANLIGDPIYYNASNQTVRPTHHYLNSYQFNANAYFLEGKLLTGWNDLAAGGQFAYVPGRWGGYGSVMFGENYNYLSAGPVLRLSGYSSPIDWQLYGGAIYGSTLGTEVGLRVAQGRTHNHRFCWNSVSVGMAWIDGESYFTCGFSLEISAIALLGVLDWFYFF